MAYSNKYTKEVENTLNLLSSKNDKSQNEKLKKYLGTKLHVYGLNSQTQVNVCKKGFSFYSDNKEKNFHEFHNIYLQSKSHEGKNQAYIYLDKYYKYIPVKTQLELLPQWVNQVDNWAHSDYLSKFLTRLVEHPDTQKPMLALIKKWNTSSNLWVRRQSLVSLYYYARTKKQQVPFALSEKLVTNLLHDEEYYVQKAVGWSLRESFNVYPKETYHFIEQNIKHIKPAAFTTCLEKMTEKQKLTLKAKRK